MVNHKQKLLYYFKISTRQCGEFRFSWISTTIRVLRYLRLLFNISILTHFRNLHLVDQIFEQLRYYLQQNMKYNKLKLKNEKPVLKSTLKKKQPEVQQIFNANLKQKDKVTTFQPFIGKGLACTSGVTVYGTKTNFREECQKGDSIMFKNPLLNTYEERPIMLVVSQVALLLQSPFIQEFINFTQYQIHKKPKVEKGEDLTQNYKTKLQDLNKTKGIKKATMDVRLRKGTWTYERKKVEVDPNLSKQQRLDLRQKMQKDKFCW